MFGFSGGFNVDVGASVSDLSGRVGISVGGSGSGKGGKSSSSSYETQLREQYDVKISTYETKITEHTTTIKKLEASNRDWDLKFRAKDNELVNLKAEFNVKLDALDKDKKKVKAERDDFQVQLEAQKRENSQLRVTITDYDRRVNELLEKIRFYENETKLKQERMKDMESKLLEANASINAQLSLDMSLETKVQNQNEMIRALSEQLERMKIEDAAEDIKFAEMEHTIKLQKEQIELFQKQINDLNEKLAVSGTTVEVETTEIYISLETRYNESVAETEQLKMQVNLKTNTIRDLEARISNLNGKISNLNGQIEDLKHQIENTENAHLDTKRALSEYELRINVLVRESAGKDSKLASFDNILKSKDVKINQLTDMIKARDAKIEQYEKQTQTDRSTLLELRTALETKLSEITAWKAEDEKDNAQIAELMNMVKNQNETIHKWEEENRRDDARIAELEQTVQAKEEHIARLKEFVFHLRGKFIEVRQSAMTLEIADEVTIQAKHSQLISNIVESEQYKSLEVRVSQKDADIAALKSEIHDYKEQLAKALDSKNAALAQVEALNVELSHAHKSVDEHKNMVATYESKLSTMSSRIETESTTTIVAQHRVGEFKNTINTRTEEVENMFKEVETLLA